MDLIVGEKLAIKKSPSLAFLLYNLYSLGNPNSTNSPNIWKYLQYDQPKKTGHLQWLVRKVD